MTNMILKSTLFLGAALTMGLNAQAQSTKVTIPFAFEATGKSLPAGEYRVRPVGNMNSIYAMVNVQTHESVLLSGKQTIGVSEEAPRLIFDRAGDDYYLTEYWDGSVGKKLSCPRPRGAFLATTKGSTRVSITAK